ncbi:hypothetical protein, partial [Acinetobacter indicus]|uniref:hypothetical protein n=1 Tax=Acinetobacter indicus TaxID=756892 RepID=UPI00144401A6
EKDLNAFKHAQHKTFKESAKDDLQQIARIYSELERHAKILQDHDIELPTATKEEKSLFGLIKKEVELDFGWRDLDEKMYETGEYRQVLTEISDDESKHDAKLRSDALDRSLVQEWSNDLAKENKERIAQENANKQHIQNKPENTVQNTVKAKQKEISKDDSPSRGF